MGRLTDRPTWWHTDLLVGKQTHKYLHCILIQIMLSLFRFLYAMFVGPSGVCAPGGGSSMCRPWTRPRICIFLQFPETGALCFSACKWFERHLQINQSGERTKIMLCWMLPKCKYWIIPTPLWSSWTVTLTNVARKWKNVTQLLSFHNVNTMGLKWQKNDKKVFGKENVELFRKHKTRFMKVQKCCLVFTMLEFTVP